MLNGEESLVVSSYRPGNVLDFDLCHGKFLEFGNSVICPGIDEFGPEIWNF